ncbi:MAG: hypothetical protein LBE82_09900 [Chitinophagaceae bacterium]|jgi:heme A synthase|nr:hypothetical protein [Chitinophagaceae bacterium]
MLFQEQNSKPQVISYRHIRRAVGIIGIALPVVLYLVYWLINQDCKHPPSISHYFYTGMSTYFTGTLCAVALFMYCYKGYDKPDNIATNLAAVFALGVALSPCNIADKSTDIVTFCYVFRLPVNCVRNTIHYASATFLFVDFAIISLFLFTKNGIGKLPTPNKRVRNKIYRICGIIIIVSIVLIALADFVTPFGNLVHPKFPLWTFFFEMMSLFAFGTSWLVKGETIFRD